MGVSLLVDWNILCAGNFDLYVHYQNLFLLYISLCKSFVVKIQRHFLLFEFYVAD